MTTRQFLLRPNTIAFNADGTMSREMYRMLRELFDQQQADTTRLASLEAQVEDLQARVAALEP